MDVNLILHTLKLPDIVTLLNALCGIMAIILILNGFTCLAPILILIAAVADGVDGHVARKFSSSEMGSNLDSLADVISFGVAPVIIMFSAEPRYLILPALAFYFICGILRLARFNTMHKELSSFKGLPITAGGIIMSSYLLMAEQFLNAYIAALISLILGILMISDLPYMKVRNRQIQMPLTIIFAATIISYTISIEYTHIMAALLSGIMAIYVVSPIISKRTA